MTRSDAYVDRLEIRMANMEDTIEQITRERDRLSREVVDLTRQRDQALDQLTAVVEQRDELAATIAQPVYELLIKTNKLRSHAEDIDQARGVTLRQLSEATARNHSLKQVNEQLRVDLETTRNELRNYKDRIVQAEEKIIELAVGLEPDTPILRERSARTRAIEAAQNAEASMERGEYRDATSWSQVSGAWASVAMIPERRDTK